MINKIDLLVKHFRIIKIIKIHAYLPKNHYNTLYLNIF
jgi:hypothetical protein